LIDRATEAARKGDLKAAFAILVEATEMFPDSIEAWDALAQLRSAEGQYEAAAQAYGRVLKIDPDRAEFYNRRGAEQFKAGRIDESIADFDKYIKLVPEARPGHWMRGISYYYAGRYDDGRLQFEGYQTVDDSDVENAVWRYLCMARDVGVDAARTGILKIGRDPRVPMSQVYDLFGGKAQPDDVLAAANAGQPAPAQLNERLFYAHLYLGLYHEAAGDAKQALEHIGRAADDHKIGHYMWHVARVHAERLRASDEAPAGDE
jgi:lipoprotein NlpI